MKNVAIWFFGIFGCAVTGSLVGELINPTDGAGPGVLVGALLFVCIRLFVPEQLAKQRI